jgi:hypothetical protein
MFDGSSHSTCAFSSAVSAGDLLVGCVLVDSGHTVVSVADSVNGAWSLAETAATSQAGIINDVCYYFQNSGAGTPTVTVTESSTGALNVIKLVAFSGVKTSSAKVASNHANGAAAAATLTGASASATTANQLLIGFVGKDAGNAVAPNNGETESLDANFSQIEYKLTPGSGSVAPTWAFSPNDGGGNQTLIFDALSTTPTFSSGPTYAKVDNNTIRATFTAASGSTAYCVPYARGASVPTATQVKAGTNARGTPATAATTGSSQTLDFDTSDSPAFPKYDPYCVLDNGTLSAVPTTSTTQLDPPTTCGAANDQPCQYVTLTSVALGGAAAVATLPYDTQTVNYIVNDVLTGGTSGAVALIQADSDSGATGTLTLQILSGTFQDNETITGGLQGSALVNGTASFLYAANDVLVAPTYPMPLGNGGGVSDCGATAGIKLCIAADGSVVYNSGGSERETALNIKVYDDSSVAYASGDIDYVNNDGVTTCLPIDVTRVLLVGAAMTAFDLDDVCSHALGDALTSTAIGTLPTGITLTGATNVTAGTPTVENESGVTIRYVVSNTYGSIAIKDATFYPVTSWTVAPNCAATPTPSQTCKDAITALAHGAVTFNADVLSISMTVAVGNVISMSPAGGAQLVPYTAMTLTVSRGVPGSSVIERRRRR